LKFFIDENSHLQIGPILGSIYSGAHEFRTFQQENLSGLEDIPLFEKLARRGFAGLITADKEQHRKPDERQALIDNHLYWIGHKRVDVSGPKGILLTVAGVVAGFPFILESLELNAEPRAFQIKGVGSDSAQRLKEWTFQKSTSTRGGL
jgi:hypothetical protein